MTAPVRLALFAVLLAAAFGAAALAGAAIDPGGPATSGDAAHVGDSHGESHGAHPETGGGSLPGLSMSQDGLRLELAQTRVARLGRTPIAFRILGEDGRAVRDFDVLHDRRLHMIVARRDLSSFAHLHPEMAADGTWSATADLEEGGTYRVFADFAVEGTQRTLGADVQVPGTFGPRALPAPADAARDDHGLRVRRRQEADGTVAFDVLRDGRVVNDELEDYLGAKGHLVTLRAGDLAYLHTHPEADRLAFGVELPGPGAYRSWVQFQLDGTVHTAAFTELADR